MLEGIYAWNVDKFTLVLCDTDILAYCTEFITLTDFNQLFYFV